MSKLIYIADDEKHIRDLIHLFLTNAGFTVETFPSGDMLWQRYLTTPPDLIVLDIMMPGTNGLTLCERIRSNSDIPIIIVSAKDEETDRIIGIMKGSDDYLVKPFSPMELVVRIQAIFRRMERQEQNKTQDKICYGDLVADTDKREIYVNGFPLDITSIQYDLLLYFIQNAEKALSREKLISYVWKAETDVGVRITDDMVKRVRKKLTAAESSVKIESVWGYGFKLMRENS